jgi:hypothetical protein
LMSRRNKTSLIAASLAAAVALVLALELTAGSRGALKPPSSRPDSVAVAGSPPIHLAEAGPGTSRFSVLRPASAARISALPLTVARVLAEPPVIPGTAGPEPGTVSALGTVNVGASEMGVAEVNGGLCLFFAGLSYEAPGVGNCVSLEQARTGEGTVAMPNVSPDIARIVGVVPDGVRRVFFESGDAKQEATVRSNMYVVELKETTTTATGLTRSGSPVFQVSMPLDQLAD